jgi:hypothetical protein
MGIPFPLNVDANVWSLLSVEAKVEVPAIQTSLAWILSCVVVRSILVTKEFDC